jgi:hypothetical protein
MAFHNSQQLRAIKVFQEANKRELKIFPQGE